MNQTAKTVIIALLVVTGLYLVYKLFYAPNGKGSSGQPTSKFHDLIARFILDARWDKEDQSAYEEAIRLSDKELKELNAVYLKDFATVHGGKYPKVSAMVVGENFYLSDNMKTFIKNLDNAIAV